MSTTAVKAHSACARTGAAGSARRDTRKGTTRCSRVSSHAHREDRRASRATAVTRVVEEVTCRMHEVTTGMRRHAAPAAPAPTGAPAAAIEDEEGAAGASAPIEVVLLEGDARVRSPVLHGANAMKREDEVEDCNATLD